MFPVLFCFAVFDLLCLLLFVRGIVVVAVVLSLDCD